jgi:uncharacterized membrane protein YdbT with pleckstrin-like domain
MDLHLHEAVIFEGHPSWRALLAFYAVGVGGAVAIAVVVALVGRIGMAILIGAVLVAAVLVVGFAKRMATRYLVTTRRLSIRRGIVARRMQQTRIDRVQNVNTEQSTLERVLRIGTVDFDTAGTDDSEFRFVGIAGPGHVVETVDRTQRKAADRAAAPRFARQGPDRA